MARLANISYQDVAARLQSAVLPREEALAEIRRYYEQARAVLDAAVIAKKQPMRYVREHSRLMDKTIRLVWDYCLLQCGGLPENLKLCAIATGGYGRHELYPYSDVDIWLAYQGDVAGAEPFIRPFLASLWDIGLNVGAATRSLSDTKDALKQDAVIATALIDARYLCGERGLFRRWQKHSQKNRLIEWQPGWLDAKLEERAARHQKQGDSRFLLEPNIKENKGGLRDLHLLYWLARGVYGVKHPADLVKSGLLSAEEFRQFRQAHRFLALIRIHLHLLSGRSDERLSFDRQLDLGTRLGYRHDDALPAAERFMKDYFRTARRVGHLSGVFTALLEENQPQGLVKRLAHWFHKPALVDRFVLCQQQLAFDEMADLAAEPSLMIRLFHVSEFHRLPIHASAMRQITLHLPMVKTVQEDAACNEWFIEILTSPYTPDTTLLHMNDCGVLAAFIPEFAPIVGQMQYDRYHVYTVDEHTLRLIGNLRSIEHGEAESELPLATHLIQQMTQRRALYLAAFCHDIAKGKGGNHAQRGLQINRKLGKRFGLNDAEISMACFLVEHHLLFSDMAFSRDLDDPQTLLDFISIVQSAEQLRLLLLLTVADIRAVGPTVWNGWKGSLLRDLYARAEAAMGTPLEDTREQLIQQAMHKAVQRLHSLPEQAVNAYTQNATEDFWLGLPEEQHPAMLQLWQQVCAAPEQTIAISYDIRLFEAITDLRICLADHHALMQQVAGVIAIIGGTILGCKSFTLKDGIAVMLLEIQDAQSKAYEDRAKLDSLAALLQSSLHGDYPLAYEVARRRRKPLTRHFRELSPQIFFNNHSSRTHTIIEVTAADRVGLLHDIAASFAEMKLNIVTSHITTYGEKAVDVFYVKDQYGLKLEHPARRQQIESALLARLQETPSKGVEHSCA